MRICRNKKKHSSFQYQYPYHRTSIRNIMKHYILCANIMKHYVQVTCASGIRWPKSCIGCHRLECCCHWSSFTALDGIWVDSSKSTSTNAGRIHSIPAVLVLVSMKKQYHELLCRMWGQHMRRFPGNHSGNMYKKHYWNNFTTVERYVQIRVLWRSISILAGDSTATPIQRVVQPVLLLNWLHSAHVRWALACTHIPGCLYRVSDVLWCGCSSVCCWPGSKRLHIITLLLTPIAFFSIKSGKCRILEWSMV